jgi:hypothetical protein
MSGRGSATTSERSERLIPRYQVWGTKAGCEHVPMFEIDDLDEARAKRLPGRERMA